MAKKENVIVKNIFKNKADLKYTYTRKWIEIINKKEKDKNNLNTTN